MSAAKNRPETELQSAVKLAPKAHDWVLEMEAYVPGKSSLDGVTDPVKLSSNESIYGASPHAVEAYGAAAEKMLRYPDANSVALRTAIADVHGLDAEKIVCGTGSDELLTLLIHTYAGPGDDIIYSQYGFALYAVQANAVGATGVAVPNKNWVADVDGILEAVTEDTKLVFVDNPNNPTGAYVCWDEIQRLQANLPEDVLLVLDGAYAECVTAEDFDAGASLVEKYENVVMTRTFSKMYALAGLRVGWAYAPPAIIDVLNRVRMPFNVGVAAGPAAVEAVKDQAHLKAAVAFTAEWRDWMTTELTTLGLDVVDSQTNFLLVAFPAGNMCAAACNEYLMGKGYLVRALPALPDHLRISVGTAEQNNCLLSTSPSPPARTRPRTPSSA